MPTRFLFALTTGVGAFLTFVVQPMAGKAVLPALGGAPAVWTVCLSFFQLALLAGYAYAHLGIGKAGLIRQAPVHLLLLLAATLMLPLDIGHVQSVMNSSGAGSVTAKPEWALLLWLVRTVGLPYALLASTAPLLQRWFLEVREDQAADPYPLYSTSNIGSMAGLLAYPFLIEPYLSLGEQTRLWSAGFICFTMLVFLCMIRLAAGPGKRRTADGQNLVPDVEIVSDDYHNRIINGTIYHAPVSMSGGEEQPSYGSWMFWSALPASLLAGVTAHVSTDVAPLPLLWVLPLSAYLLSFIIVFAKPAEALSWKPLAAMPLACAVLMPLLIWKASAPIWMQVGVHVTAFFSICLVFHGLIAHTRPSPEKLTGFYLAVATGGALGGAFNGFAAPRLFSSLVEYPLVLAIAAVFYPASSFQAGDRGRVGWIASVLFTAAVTGIMWNTGAFGSGASVEMLFMTVAATTLLTFLAWRQPRFWGMTFAILLAAGMNFAGSDKGILLKARSFYGVFQVVETGSGRYHLLEHGNIHHGGQLRVPGKQQIPLFYYARESPVGKVFREMAIGRRSRNVAIVGLGTGGLAAYGRPWQKFTFFEIDPLIAGIAKNPDLFSFLRDSKADTRIILGDARIMIRNAADGAFNLIILDAYSSDAIPVHLLTREAVELYRRKLAPGGMLLFHISNRYLDLEPILGAVASNLGLTALTARYDPGDDEELHYENDARYVFGSKWMLVAEKADIFGQIVRDPLWRTASSGSPEFIWTDGFSSIWQAYRDR
ncbi:MAG TPA: fused MFS/spermidine synthase [Candidatus Ozemobacteraceae bacterium]|nr:fused MFS/spermidine synthase [Candidatus Ozemobacteraceae bacterium]